MLGLILSLSVIMAEEKSLSDEAWGLIKSKNYGTLSTSYEEVPFGSFMPYVLDEKKNPIIYISDLALHTQNLNKNGKCSLTILKVDKKDLFNSSRATIILEAKKVPDKEVEALYFKKFPSAKRFVVLHDFSFYRLEVKKIYYVGSFGNIGWIE